MNRREELRARRAELAAEIPELANLLEDKLTEYEGIHRELEALDQQRRHLRVIDGGKKAGAILVPILLLRGLPRQRLALAAASTAAVGATAVILAVAVPSKAHGSNSAPRPAVTMPVPVASRLGTPAPVVSASPPRPSVGPSSVRVTVVAPSDAVPEPAAPVAASVGVTVALTVVLRSTVSMPALLPSLPVSLSTPSLPVSLPSLTLPTAPVPTPTGTCLVQLDLQPVAGACVL